MLMTNDLTFITLMMMKIRLFRHKDNEAAVAKLFRFILSPACLGFSTEAVHISSSVWEDGHTLGVGFLRKVQRCLRTWYIGAPEGSSDSALSQTW